MDIFHYNNAQNSLRSGPQTAGLHARGKSLWYLAGVPHRTAIQRFLCMGFVDVDQRGVVAQVQLETGGSGLVQQRLPTSGQVGAHPLVLRRFVPVRRGRHRTVVGAEAHQHRVAVMADLRRYL